MVMFPMFLKKLEVSMSAIKMTVHRVEQIGVCSLSSRDGEVLVVSFEDGTLTEGSLSQKSFMQLLRMKLGQNGKKPAETKKVEAGTAVSPQAFPVGNGPAKGQ